MAGFSGYSIVDLTQLGDVPGIRDSVKSTLLGDDDGSEDWLEMLVLMT